MCLAGFPGDESSKFFGETQAGEGVLCLKESSDSNTSEGFISFLEEANNSDGILRPILAFPQVILLN